MGQPLVYAGPVDAIWDPSGLNITFSTYMETAEVKSTENYIDIMVAQLGANPYDMVKNGQDPVEFTMDFTVPNDFEILNSLFPNSTLSGTTTQELVISNVVGGTAYGSAKELVLTPYEEGVPTTDVEKKLHLFKAFPRMDTTISFKADTQIVYQVIFRAFPDRTPGNVNAIWKIGTASA